MGSWWDDIRDGVEGAVDGVVSGVASVITAPITFSRSVLSGRNVLDSTGQLLTRTVAGANPVLSANAGFATGSGADRTLGAIPLVGAPARTLMDSASSINSKGYASRATAIDFYRSGSEVGALGIGAAYAVPAAGSWLGAHPFLSGAGVTAGSNLLKGQSPVNAIVDGVAGQATDLGQSLGVAPPVGDWGSIADWFNQAKNTANQLGIQSGSAGNGAFGSLLDASPGSVSTLGGATAQAGASPTSQAQLIALGGIALAAWYLSSKGKL